MIKENCENKYASLIVLIFYFKNVQKSKLSLETKNLQWEIKRIMCLAKGYAGVCFRWEFDFLDFPKKPPKQHVETIFCNSPAVILGEFLATQTILLILKQFRHMSSSMQICNNFCWLEMF